jgi:hypothetical protein
LERTKVQSSRQPGLWWIFMGFKQQTWPVNGIFLWFLDGVRTLKYGGLYWKYLDEG